MTFQTAVKSRGFRELDAQELESVSGGTGSIVVTAPQSSGNLWSGSGDGAGGLGSGLSSFQFMDLSALAHLATVDWDKFFADMEALRQSQEDLDGDGEPGITVTGDGPLPDTFGEMTFDQIVIWNTAWLQSDGVAWFADQQAGTNISGDNPNDIRNADRKAELEAEQLGEAFDRLYDELTTHIP